MVYREGGDFQWLALFVCLVIQGQLCFELFEAGVCLVS